MADKMSHANRAGRSIFHYWFLSFGLEQRGVLLSAKMSSGEGHPSQVWSGVYVSHSSSTITRY
jgi:hypothetical protein